MAPADFSLKSLKDLGMQVDRVASFVKKTPVDARVVIAGSREILEWFANGPVPAFATLLRERTAAIHQEPQTRVDFVKEMRRFLPASTVRQVVESPSWWDYLNQMIQDQAKLALAALCNGACCSELRFYNRACG